VSKTASRQAVIDREREAETNKKRKEGRTIV
jgi:hypothetical protein